MDGLRTVGAFPFDVRPGEVEANLAVVRDALAQAAAAGVQLLCLPEKWTTSFLPSYDAEVLARSEVALLAVHESADVLGMTVIGSAPAGRGANGKPFNQVHHLGMGGLQRPYCKRALFSPTGEGRQVARGTELPRSLETAAGSATSLICYDLRFPELTREAFYATSDFLVVPAQWPHPRTSIWELLSCARSAENQQWGIACNRSGIAGLDGKHLMEFPGSALVIDPYGEVVARTDSGELLVAEVDLAVAAAARKKVPCQRDLGMAELGPAARMG